MYSLQKYFLLASALLCAQSLTGAEIQKNGRPTPQQALQQLIDGNVRYTKDAFEHPNRGQDRRDALTETQEPFAAVIGCSDSRVSPTLVFDQGVGDLFEVRVAGNVVGPVVLASVEYAVNVLGASLIMVLGHENCGAVKAVLAGQGNLIEPIGTKVETALKEFGKGSQTPTENAIKANIRYAVQQLKETPSIKKLIAEKKVDVVGGYFSLSTGQVEICCNLSQPVKP